jgi:hypothetical protein
MRAIRSVQFGLIGMLMLGTSLLAHHTFEAEFDTTRPIHADGRVVKIDWVNPHVYVDLDVTNDPSISPRLRLELPGPNQLFNLGWTPKTLQPNMDLTVEGFRSKMSASTTVGTASVTIKATGQVLKTPAARWHHSFAK